MALQIRRGLEADRTDITPAQGEPIYTTDTKQLFVGDGVTAGGIAVGGGGTLTIDTQDFTASGTWTKPANAVWVEVTMCGAGQAGAGGTTVASGFSGSAGKPAQKTFLAADLSSTVAVTCGASQAFGVTATDAPMSAFGTYLYAGGPLYGPNDELGGISVAEAAGAQAANAWYTLFGCGATDDIGGTTGSHGFVFQGGGGGRGGDLSSLGNLGAGFDGGKAATGMTTYGSPARGGGGAGGASGATGANGSAGGYDSVTGFGHGGGGGGEGTSGAGGNGGAAVRGGGGGGGGKCASGTSSGGAGGDGFVRVRTLCFG